MAAVTYAEVPMTFYRETGSYMTKNEAPVNIDFIAKNNTRKVPLRLSQPVYLLFTYASFFGYTAS